MISEDGCMHTDIIEHEFLHSIGLYHTQVLLSLQCTNALVMVHDHMIIYDHDELIYAGDQLFHFHSAHTAV